MLRSPNVIWQFLCVVLLCAVSGCSETAPPVVVELPPAVDMRSVTNTVETFCADCHGLPRPEHFTMELWPTLISEGYQFYIDSGREDLTPPPVHEVMEFYGRTAPAQSVLHFYPPGNDSTTVRFRSSPVAIDKPTPTLFCAGVLRWFPLQEGGPHRMVWGDIRDGGLYLADIHSSVTTKIQLENPARIEPCDLDGDGLRDLVVADLGSCLPNDHLDGRVVWLRGNGTAHDDAVVLAENVGRVADVRPGDFDNDGDQDLIVAEFGWRTTGSVFLLLNQGQQDGVPRFVKQTVDGRHGAIHVPTLDIDGDGRLDFITLLSQEHEVVELFLNVGHDRSPRQIHFERRIVFEADDPAFGSSGIELTDLDADGDLDVLLTNGDIYDTKQARPFQGIHWLENQGQYPFKHHLITRMPGVHRALACDVDGDNDLDIAAAALVPLELVSTTDLDKLDSLIWLEQTEPGTFERHALETGNCWHAALEVGDFDDDGDIDLAVGNFLLDRDVPGLPWLTLWENLGSEQDREQDR